MLLLLPVVIQLLNLDCHFLNNHFQVIESDNKLNQNCKCEVTFYAIVCMKGGLIEEGHTYENVSVRFAKYRNGIKNLRN